MPDLPSSLGEDGCQKNHAKKQPFQSRSGRRQLPVQGGGSGRCPWAGPSQLILQTTLFVDACSGMVTTFRTFSPG